MKKKLTSKFLFLIFAAVVGSLMSGVPFMRNDSISIIFSLLRGLR